jgi:molybdopterin-guanine dinucleotide biosynthesis protein A
MSQSCIILAGGKSVRLGRDKISERIDNSSLLELVISHVESLVSEIIIVVAQERSFPQVESHQKIKKVSDFYPGNGSLGGIHAGLVASSSFYNLVVAADMPFLNPPLLRYIFEVSDGFDFVLPRIETFFEPLHAVYSKNCIEPAESIIKRGRKAIIGLFDYVRVRYVEAEEIDRFDPKRLSFFNINTREDLELARAIAFGAR